MPLKKCTSNQKSGYKWGDSGKCYTGPDAKKNAIKQGVAIEGPEKFSQKAAKECLFLDRQDIKTVTDWMYEEGYDHIAVVATAATLSTQSDQIAGYPPNCNHGYEEQDGKCVPIKDVESVVKYSWKNMQNLKEGGPVCPEGHEWDYETEQCIPQGEKHYYDD